jgi:hypothetical protein
MIDCITQCNKLKTECSVKKLWSGDKETVKVRSCIRKMDFWWHFRKPATNQCMWTAQMQWTSCHSHGMLFSCALNSQVQKSKLVQSSFSRIVKHSRTFWLMKVRTLHCLEMSLTNWHSVINKNEIFLSKALLYIVFIMCQALVYYTTDVMPHPYSDGASTFIWNVNQFFRYISVWKLRNDHVCSF